MTSHREQALKYKKQYRQISIVVIEKMALQNSSKKIFKNTFAPHVKNENLSVHDVITGLRTTLFDAKDLPVEVQDAVTAELRKQKGDAGSTQ